MKASIIDLGYKATDILRALDRNESVTVLYGGKIRGIIKPVKEKSELKVKDHPFFNMYRTNANEGTKDLVFETLDDLRKPRYDF